MTRVTRLLGQGSCDVLDKLALAGHLEKSVFAKEKRGSLRSSTRENGVTRDVKSLSRELGFLLEC